MGAGGGRSPAIEERSGAAAPIRAGYRRSLSGWFLPDARVRQSQRDAIYRTPWKCLPRRNVYACDERGARSRGACRRAERQRCALRPMPRSRLRWGRVGCASAGPGPERFVDGILGAQEQDPRRSARCPDPRSTGTDYQSLPRSTTSSGDRSGASGGGPLPRRPSDPDRRLLGASDPRRSAPYSHEEPARSEQTDGDTGSRAARARLDSADVKEAARGPASLRRITPNAALATPRTPKQQISNGRSQRQLPNAEIV